jgi:hypothetical protein
MIVGLQAVHRMVLLSQMPPSFPTEWAIWATNFMQMALALEFIQAPAQRR